MGIIPVLYPASSPHENNTKRTKVCVVTNVFSGKHDQRQSRGASVLRSCVSQHSCVFGSRTRLTVSAETLGSALRCTCWETPRMETNAIRCFCQNVTKLMLLHEISALPKILTSDFNLRFTSLCLLFIFPNCHPPSVSCSAPLLSPTFYPVEFLSTTI